MKELDKILSVTNWELDELDTTFINRYIFYHQTNHFHLPSGREHYRLLIYVSTLFKDKTLYDIGTNKCMSAAALSYSMKNIVKTYDLIKFLPSNPILPLTKYILGDIIQDEKLINSPFIFFDVDHNGIFEKIFYDHLKKINYKGLLMCDDILQKPKMEEWWGDIEEEKYDLTKKGHWNGTGLIYFS